MSSWSDLVMSYGPAAWWRLAADFSDSSGGGHTAVQHGTGTVTFGAPSLRPCDANGGATFAPNAYAEVTYASWMDFPTGLTVIVWATAPPASGIYSLVDRDFGSGSAQNFQFRINNGKFEIISDWGSAIAVTGATALTPGQAYRFVMTWDGTTVRAYVDKTLDASAAYGGTPAAAGDLLIGGSFGETSGVTQFYSGEIDEVIYIPNACLTQTQLDALYDAAQTSAAPAFSGGAPVATTTTAAGGGVKQAQGGAAVITTTTATGGGEVPAGPSGGGPVVTTATATGGGSKQASGGVAVITTTTATGGGQVVVVVAAVTDDVDAGGCYLDTGWAIVVTPIPVPTLGADEMPADPPTLYVSP